MKLLKNNPIDLHQFNSLFTNLFPAIAVQVRLVSDKGLELVQRYIEVMVQLGMYVQRFDRVQSPIEQPKFSKSTHKVNQLKSKIVFHLKALISLFRTYTNAKSFNRHNC